MNRLLNKLDRPLQLLDGLNGSLRPPLYKLNWPLWSFFDELHRPLRWLLDELDLRSLLDEMDLWSLLDELHGQLPLLLNELDWLLDEHRLGLYDLDLRHWDINETLDVLDLRHLDNFLDDAHLGHVDDAYVVVDLVFFESSSSTFLWCLAMCSLSVAMVDLISRLDLHHSVHLER